MKKAFSLIEIMQTLILLGIIAGLSVSFFKRINANPKLYAATEKQLQLAIEEANRQMCNDYTPYCEIGGVRTPWVDNCSTIYGATSTYSDTGATKGYCVADRSDGACPPTLSKQDTNKYLNIPQMVYNGHLGKCMAAPYCINTTPDITCDEVGYVCYSGKSAKPFSEIVCSEGIPDYSQQKDNVNVLCWYLHSLIAHKKQGNTDDDDLLATCNPNSTAFQSEYNFISHQNNLKYYAKRVREMSDNYNMLLPNGVRLYNLGGNMDLGGSAAARAAYSATLGGNKSGANNIYIKYDRMPDAKTAAYNGADSKSTTIQTMRIYNPSWVECVGECSPSTVIKKISEQTASSEQYSIEASGCVTENGACSQTIDGEAKSGVAYTD